MERVQQHFLLTHADPRETTIFKTMGMKEAATLWETVLAYRNEYQRKVVSSVEEEVTKAETERRKAKTGVLVKEYMTDLAGSASRLTSILSRGEVPNELRKFYATGKS